MARELRADFPGARHHVMNRGLRGQIIFHGGDDAIAFLDLVSQLPERFGIEVHGYALMPNHFHLMLRSVHGNLAEAMRWLGLMWTQRTNRKHPDWDGPVFRGRYRSCVVDSEQYWGHLLAYLHLNPVRGRLALDVDRADWTSHRVYLGESRADWLCTDELRDWYVNPRSYRAYLDDVRTGRQGNPEGFGRVVDWGARNAVVAPVVRDAAGSGQRRSVAEVEQLLDGVLGRSWPEVTAREGRNGSPETAFAAWAMHRFAGISQADLARTLGVHPSAVQKRVQRVDRMRHLDPSLWRLVGRLDRALARRAAHRIVCADRELPAAFLRSESRSQKVSVSR